MGRLNMNLKWTGQGEVANSTNYTQPPPPSPPFLSNQKRWIFFNKVYKNMNKLYKTKQKNESSVITAKWHNVPKSKKRAI